MKEASANKDAKKSAGEFCSRAGKERHGCGSRHRFHRCLDD